MERGFIGKVQRALCHHLAESQHGEVERGQAPGEEIKDEDVMTVITTLSCVSTERLH